MLIELHAYTSGKVKNIYESFSLSTWICICSNPAAV